MTDGMTVFEAYEKSRRGEGMLIIRDPCPAGMKAMEFFEFGRKSNIMRRLREIEDRIARLEAMLCR
jgi:hypothetical protein